MYSVLVDHVDEAFRTILLAHMHDTEDFQAFRSLVVTIQKEAEQARGKVEKDLARIERRMQATLISLTTDPDIPQKTRTALNQIYAELEQQKEALLAPPKQKTPVQQLGTLLSYHELLEQLSHEEALERVLEDMQLLSQATTKHVTLDGLSPHFLLLTIEWRTPIWGTEKALLWRPRGRAPFWPKADEDIVTQYYPSMPQEELMQLLPQRSWQSIITKAQALGISRKVRTERLTKDTTLSYEDMQVMEHYHLTLEELSSDNQIIWLGSTVSPNGF